MSSAIREAEKLNSRQLETVRRRLDREVKNLENSHQNYKAELKKAHQSEILDIQDTHAREVAGQAQRKEKILEEMRGHLQKTQEMTDKELKDLKEEVVRIRNQEQQKLALQREQIKDEHELYLEDLNYRFNSQGQKINEDGKERIEEAKQNFGEAYTQNEAYHQSRINKQTEEFTTRFHQDEQNYKQLKDQQERLHKNERLTTNQRQQVEMSKLTESHQKQLNVRDDQFRKGIKDQDLFFEKKYAEHLSKNNKDLQALNDLHEKVVSKMKEDLSQKMIQTVNRAEDPFFRMVELNPTMTQYPDRVEVKVPVPDHSKQDLQLSLNRKEIILNFNRRFSEDRKTEDGIINKVNKIETFTSKLTADAFLDPKSVKSSYQDGVMTYVIKKA